MSTEKQKKQNLTEQDPFSGSAEQNDKALKLIEVLRDIDHVNAAIIIPPKIDVKAPVYYGTSHDILSIGTGLLRARRCPLEGRANMPSLPGTEGLIM